MIYEEVFSYMWLSPNNYNSVMDAVDGNVIRPVYSTFWPVDPICDTSAIIPKIKYGINDYDEYT